MNSDFLTYAFTRFRTSLRNIAAGIAGNNQADDILHDAFCRLWNSHNLIASEKEAMKLSYTTVRNSAIDTLRRTNARPPTVSIEDQPVQLPYTDETELEKERQQIYQAVISLSKKVLNTNQYEIFRLHDIEGIEYSEIAIRLSTTPQNVRMTLSRARKTIRELYLNKNNQH